VDLRLPKWHPVSRFVIYPLGEWLLRRNFKRRSMYMITQAVNGVLHALLFFLWFTALGQQNTALYFALGAVVIWVCIIVWIAIAPRRFLR